MKYRRLFILFMSFAVLSAIFSSAVVGKAAEKTSASEVSSSAIGVASDSAIGLSDVAINATSRKMGIGEKFKLKLSDLPDDAKVTWKSSNKKIASVTKKGNVHALAVGKAKITAEVGDKKFKCKVTVKNKGLEFASYTMSAGEIFTLHISAGAKVKWSGSYSDSDLGTITSRNKGFVKFKADNEGTAVIKAKSDGKTYYCNVKVKKADKSVICLTFDDGPSLTSTPKILNILKKNNVNATFFVINYSGEGENLIKREVSEGNAVAIHGFSHDYAKIYRSDSAYVNNITTLQNKLFKTLGYRVWATRFPGGSSNLVSRHYNRGIMRRLVKTVDSMGYSYFDWNVSSGDAGGATNSSQVYSNVTKGLRKNRVNIVLMHDFSNNNKTIGALDGIIKYGKSHGYVFKVINNSTIPVHHGVQN